MLRMNYLHIMITKGLISVAANLIIKLIEQKFTFILQYNSVCRSLFPLLLQSRVVITGWRPLTSNSRTSVLSITLTNNILGHMIACRAIIMFCLSEQFFHKFYKRRLFFIDNDNLFVYYKIALCTQKTIFTRITLSLLVCQWS